SRGIGAAADREEIMYAAIRLESRLPDRSGTRYERRQVLWIRRAIFVCHCELRIGERARSASRRLRMATAAAIKIESRTEARFGSSYCSLNRLHFKERVKAGIKEFAFLGR